MYRVSKEILEREYTLEDFEFKGCESITIMEYYKIYEIYSTLNELIKELYEKYKDSF